MFMFTRKLVPDNSDGLEMTITEGDDSLYFLWAVGMNNDALGYHEARGSLLIDFFADVAEITVVEVEDRSLPFLLHGILMATTWLFLLPSSIFAALNKNTFGGGNGAWMKYHKACAGERCNNALMTRRLANLVTETCATHEERSDEYCSYRVDSLLVVSLFVVFAIL